MAERIENFIVQYGDELGRGTFGNVYKAKHAHRKLLAAAKKISLLKGGIMFEKTKNLADKEFTNLEHLQEHPNIVRLLGHYTDDRSMWIFMELCDLGSLPDFMDKQRPSIRGKLKIMYECASAIAFMHSRENPIVHRDIKPGNVLMKSLGDECVVKISDFGMSKILEAVNLAEHQAMETAAGSMAFMAPEFFEHFEQDTKLKYHSSVDTFSLGLLFLVVFLYEENQRMFPQLEQTYKVQNMQPLGREMFLAANNGKPLPKLFKDDFSERQNLQQLITRMCAYKDYDRMPISEVKNKLWQFYVECEYEFQKGHEAVENSSTERVTGDGSHGKIILSVPLIEVWKDSTHKLRKCAVRDISHRTLSASSSKPCKTILLMGAIGAGKTTLLDAMMTYIRGITWFPGEQFIFLRVAEEMKKQRKAVTQTEWITIYAIPTDKTSDIPFDLQVIDTPGFGDTRGIQQDEKLISQIKHLLFNPESFGIDCLDGICLLVQSSLYRLTATWRYIFDQILSLFGRNVASNIFIMATFADDRQPPIIDVMKKERIPFMKYFKFNNSGFSVHTETWEHQSSDSDSENETEVKELYWRLSTSNFKNFFRFLGKVEPQSLMQTKDVLDHREKLKCDLAYIEEKRRLNTQSLVRIEQEKKILEQHIANIEAHKDFEYEVYEEKMERKSTKPGQYVMNCSVCFETCHLDCTCAEIDKKRCSAMTNGKCRICTNKCDWSVHYSHGYTFQLVVRREKRTHEKLKKRYESALAGRRFNETIISDLEQQYQSTTVEVNKRMKQARECLLKLREIALRRDPLFEADYIDLLIEDEKRQATTGFLQRIEQLQKLKDSARLSETLSTP